MLRCLNKIMWANHYNECQCCGTTERPYHAKGLCRWCYHKIRYDNSDLVKEKSRIATAIWVASHYKHNLLRMREYARKRRENKNQ